MNLLERGSRAFLHGADAILVNSYTQHTTMSDVRELVGTNYAMRGWDPRRPCFCALTKGEPDDCDCI